MSAPERGGRVGPPTFNKSSSTKRRKEFLRPWKKVQNRAFWTLVLKNRPKTGSTFPPPAQAAEKKFPSRVPEHPHLKRGGGWSGPSTPPRRKGTPRRRHCPAARATARAIAAPHTAGGAAGSCRPAHANSVASRRARAAWDPKPCAARWSPATDCRSGPPAPLLERETPTPRLGDPLNEFPQGRGFKTKQENKKKNKKRLIKIIKKAKKIKFALNLFSGLGL